MRAHDFIYFDYLASNMAETKPTISARNFEDYYLKYKLYYENMDKAALVSLLAHADAVFIMRNRRNAE